MTSRRDFLEQAAFLSAAAALPRRVREPGAESSGPPDAVFVQTESDYTRLTPDTGGRWTAGGIAVTTTQRPGALQVQLSAPGAEVKRLHLRWRGSLNGVRLVLGDAWERGYGDLEWRGITADRVMPWYAATFDGARTNAYGVMTGARAFCYWQIDADGISLWADVRSGAMGVQLGERTLDVCDVVRRPGRAGESPFLALHAFCRQMCPTPRLPSQPVYGHNDWYWAYGKNSAESVMADVGRIVELSPTGGNRPFAVIDDGWQPGRGADRNGAAAWDQGNDKFGDMQALATKMRQGGARPGIWIRPLLAPAAAPDSWKSTRDARMLDPTVPDVLHKVRDDITRLKNWGFDLIKHDYTTFDVFGRWGFQMGAALTKDGWSFAEGRARTTAEVIDDLYRTIRDAAGDTYVIGCNTVSHLSAGRFEMCRVGDDTSGTEWARTRKMGVNTLAFRGVQHGALYVADPDCAGVTNDVPWSMNRQWLDLLSRSGTMLFVSIAPDALGAAQRADLKAALARAAERQPLGEPLDWQETVYPARWRLMGETRTYDWVGADGAGPPD